MNWVNVFLLLALSTVTNCKEIESNDISIPAPPVKLDSTLRKALLKALTELENEENAKQQDEDEGNSRIVFYSTTARTDSDKIVERASASAVSIFAQDGEASTEKLATTELVSDKPLVIVQKSAGLQSKPITEEFLTSASSNFGEKDNVVKVNYQTRSTSGFASNSVGVDDKKVSGAGIKTVTVTASPKPETTTTLRPTSSTEESEAKVEHVQFFSAPLVAAFTVHQDERGLPKKVEPLYKNLPSSTTKPLQEHERLKQEEFHLKHQAEVLKREHQLQQQLNLQEKQKLLEQEVFQLQQERKKQEEYLIRQQQLLLEHQIRNQRFLSSNNQNKNSLVDQSFKNANDNPFIPIFSPIQSQTAKPPTQVTPNNQFQTIVHSSPSQTERPYTISTQNEFRSFSQPQNFNSNNIKNQNLISNQNIVTFNQNQQKPLINNAQSNVHIQQSISPNNNNFGTISTQNRFNDNLHNQNRFNNQNGFNNNFNNQNQVTSAFTSNNNLFRNQNQFQNNQSQFRASQPTNFNSQISVQSSISLSPSDLAAGVLPLNAQILPVKDADDFLRSPAPVQTGIISNQFVGLTPPVQHQHQQQHQQQQQQQHQQQSSFTNFQNPNNAVQTVQTLNQGTRAFRQESTGVGNLGFNNNNFIQNQNNLVQSVPAANQGTRVFRQESAGVGNLGFNQFNAQPQANRFFRSNLEGFHRQVPQVPQHQLVNQQLNNLLYNSGITRNVRQNEDLNIVSKILSYNVGSKDNFFGSSRVSEQRLQLPRH